jgi:hypothetical protein
MEMTGSVTKPDWTYLLRRPRHTYEDSIKMFLKEIGCNNVD